LLEPPAGIEPATC